MKLCNVAPDDRIAWLIPSAGNNQAVNKQQFSAAEYKGPDKK